MAVPGRLVLLVLLHICTHGTSGTPATSCDSCHNQAFCLEHKERGDTFLRHTHPYICLCKDGFVGDGLTCYDTKLCSDSSCCSSGFFWSPEKGCVDVDECTLPDSPCNSRQNCKNLPGSFECLDSLSEQGSEPLSRSFQAVCGGTFCPTGMDCIFFNGTSRCADPCHVYTVLNDSWRSTNSGIGGHCDRDISWQGWYRMFLEQASARIPVGSMELYKCETRVPMWLGEPHPTQIGVIVNRTACNSWGGCSTGHQIHVKRCYGGYYVYKLVAPSTCTYAYCSEVDEIEYSTMPPVVNRTQGPENTSPTFRPTFPPVNSTHMPTLPATSWRTTRPHHNITLPPHNTTGVEGEVRLANGGNTSCSGRVEIFHFGQWGTVCDDSWDLLDAEVVCRQLGCGRVLSAPTQARFGQGSGPIWYDNVVCTGSEAKLSECRHQGIGSHNCGHHEDAGVVCEATSPVRLANSGNRCSGRVEIFHNGQWGTVCDDHWDIDNANVVCRQLDCGTAQSALSNAAFGAGRGPIWLDDVSCSGSESSISDCRHSGFGVHNCGHHEDSSVVCEGVPNSNSTAWPTFPPVNSTHMPTVSATSLRTTQPHHNITLPPHNTTGVEGEVRLANGGNSSCSGRVEIFHFGQWGTVCDDSWDLLDAEVVCRQLGCGRVLSAPTQARFGQGSGPIWYDNVVCTGSEAKLSECRHQGIGSHDCSHSEDAGVVCEATSPVRLANSGNRCSGRVEIFHNGQWGTVCDDHWDMDNANVVCRQLDCGTAQSALSNAAFGAGRGPIWLDDVSCSGSESSISDCRHSGFGVHNCGHHEDSSVVCEGVPNSNSTAWPTFPPVNSTHMPTVSATSLRTTQPHHNITLPPHNTTGVEGEVRLANGGNSSCSGRVEIFHFGQWGTVCDDSWDLRDAEVVCRQLGCGRVLSAPTQARFGQGSGPIWYDEVRCTGSEAKLPECRHQGIGSHDCSHSEDAGVVCEATSPVRLANSGNRCSGRVEIFHNGQWGTVCDDHWDMDNANVVCRQLDCGTAQSALSNAAFGAGRGPIWLDDVSCSGSESSISDCRHSGFGVHNCGHSEDASVICGSPSPPKDAFHLHCSERKILVQVQASRLLAFGFDPFSGHLADRNCTWISESFGTIVYEVDTQPEACGNVMKTNRTHVTYINNIFLYEQNSSFSIPKRLPISCTYPLEADATLDVAVWPILVENGGISGVGSPARANMSLYRSAAFNDTYPPGSVAISVGSPLYVGVSVEDRGPNFVATLEDCFASPSRYSHTNVKYPLIQNKCPVDPRQVVVIENGRSTRARFSALFFPPNGKHTAVYLHCNLTLCDVTKYSCFTSCRRRASRSAFSSPSATPISVGPITWAD
ncbi:unnamed protein product [Ophioblennius macclurei]